MKVLHVSQPVETGVPGVVLALAADERARGHDVHVACPPGPGLADTAAAAGATHHAWAARRAPGPWVADEAARLGRIVRDVDPDVVVLHSAKAGLAGRIAVRGRIPTVLAPHAWSFEAVHGAVAAAVLAGERALARWTDRTVCVSEEERARGVDAGIDGPFTVVPNGVDTDRFAPADRAAARAELGVADRPTVVCVGRFAEQKGHDLLLDAWPAVLDRGPDAQLLLVGDGPLRADIELAAARTSGVHLLGARTDVARWLATADVVAAPSRWEGASLVSLEAMAAGRPVVGFDVGGLADSVGETGAALRPGDVDGLARALADRLADPARAARDGAAARERVTRLRDLRGTLDGWQAVLDDVVRDAVPTAAPVPGAGPEVSVVLTVLDEGEALDRVADALLAQLRPDDELVVCDGGSTDGSPERLAARQDPRVRLEVVPGAGISAGRNIAIDVAKHDVLVCTDAGCVPDPGFVDAFRTAFDRPVPPALAAGVYGVLARNALERAQAAACYPQPDEAVDPDAFVRAYTRVFGTGHDPTLCVGRCVAFTREAWQDAGGFPEHLPTGEDVAFGVAVAAAGGDRVQVPGARVDWVQRDGVAATWRMYRGYGRASTDGGGGGMLVRDALRGSAYLVAPLLARHRAGRVALAAGAAAYLSLPLRRAYRAGAGPAAAALVPVALATKDLGKLAGALQGAGRVARRRLGLQGPR
ncbi:glycosyltransferase [Pseudonocardia phyllosphaerae]|uniref:glycosyltransferase n=1 Tax=Pseudonocardia phyllosphaerae TaxID=3390502 RepID=UPI00397C30CA